MDGILFRGSAVDWSEGWSGTPRHLYVQDGPAGSHGIEGSRDGGPPAVPLLYNTTLVGGKGSGAVRQLRDGILLEGGATFRARSVVVRGFARAALEARGNAAIAWTQTSVHRSKWHAALKSRN